MSQPTQPTQNTTLSLSTRLLCYLGPPSAILLISTRSQRTALLTPLALIPTACFYQQWRKANNTNPSIRGELEPMIWIGVAAATLGAAVSIAAQLSGSLALATILFGNGKTRSLFVKEFVRSTITDMSTDELARRSQLAFSWQNWAFNAAFSFLLAGVVEETVKYLPVAYAQRRGTTVQRQKRKRSYLDYGMAGALGFGVIENIGMIHASVGKGEGTWATILLNVFERVALGSTGHFLGAWLTALRATRRDYYGERMSWWSVIGPSVLLHGTWDFTAFSFSASEGNVGWIHPTSAWKTVTLIGLGTALVAGMAWQVVSEWQALDELDRLKSL